MLGVPRAALQCVALADSTTDSFYTRHLLHPFTHFFAGNLLHQTTFAPETLYEGSLLHQVFYTRHLLPPKAFCTKCILHETHSTPNTFNTRHLLYQAFLEPRTLPSGAMLSWEQFGTQLAQCIRHDYFWHLQIFLLLLAINLYLIESVSSLRLHVCVHYLFWNGLHWRSGYSWAW